MIGAQPRESKNFWNKNSEVFRESDAYRIFEAEAPREWALIWKESEPHVITTGNTTPESSMLDILCFGHCSEFAETIGGYISIHKLKLKINDMYRFDLQRLLHELAHIDNPNHGSKWWAKYQRLCMKYNFKPQSLYTLSEHSDDIKGNIITLTSEKYYLG